jgi:hypothetical protein
VVSETSVSWCCTGAPSYLANPRSHTPPQSWYGISSAPPLHHGLIHHGARQPCFADCLAVTCSSCEKQMKCALGHLGSHLTIRPVFIGAGVAAHSAHCASGQCEANFMFRALSFGCSHQSVRLSRDRPTLPNPANHEHAYQLLPAQAWAQSSLHDSQASRLRDGLLRIGLALWVDRRKGTPCDLPRTELMQQSC